MRCRGGGKGLLSGRYFGLSREASGRFYTEDWPRLQRAANERATFSLMALGPLSRDYRSILSRFNPRLDQGINGPRRGGGGPAVSGDFNGAIVGGHRLNSRFCGGPSGDSPIDYPTVRQIPTENDRESKVETID